MKSISNPKSASLAQSSDTDGQEGTDQSLPADPAAAGRPGKGTDVLASVLSTLRLHRARYCASELSVPWGIRFGARENPIFHVIDRGGGWLLVDGPGTDGVPQALAAGDVVLLAHGHAHTLTDEPERPARTVDFDAHPQILYGGGPASWGGGGARTLLVCGEFHLDGPALHPLLAELPPLIVLRAGDSSEWLGTTLRLLSHEVLGQEPGSELIMRRLIEVIFVQCIRGWLRQDGAGAQTQVQGQFQGHAQGFLRALRDPQVARALSLMHQRPAHDWTVEELGRCVGLSRSVFSARFLREAGEPPLSYLTRWRMQLCAARLLAAPGEPLKTVAAAAGYQSEAAWNRAFRRLVGEPPAQWRERQLGRAVVQNAGG